MAEPLQRPKRKNPIVRTRLPVVPPWRRSRPALGLTAAAARGDFALQRCDECTRFQYPPREMCGGCLSVNLSWTVIDGKGELMAETRLEHSHDLYFRERLPWHLGLIRLACGPSVVAHLHGDVGDAPCSVRVGAHLDRAGRAVLIAVPDKETPNMADDRQFRELTCDPKLRRVLVTDGKSAFGQAMVRELVEAGASLVWVGNADPWKKPPGFAEICEIPEVSLVSLDVTDARSVKEVAGSIGARVDILINTAEVHRAYGIASRYGTDAARLEMEVNYLGLLRLAQEFGPAMKSRGADGQNSAVAWVNLLSIFALANLPEQGTFSASKAAAFSLSQCLRAEFRPHAVRVLNIFPGPIDDEWNQLIPPPKLAPERLAREVIAALRQGVEDVYPDAVSQEWFTRFREDPKILERELGE